jgi:hypothetical protein
MSTLRGQANQGLYLARILLTAWQRDLEAQQLPVTAVTQAYLPAVRQHLRRAYGWFLLEITRPDQVPAAPPTCTSELPAVAAGKAVPPEVRECAILEREGWLAEVLCEEGGGPEVTGSSNLATPLSDPGPQEVAGWLEQFTRLFDRMGNSLDEC